MLHLLHSDATPAGRFAADMLSPQQRMELLFTREDDDDARLQLAGNPEDACTWREVHCDGDGNFQTINWHSAFLSLSGSVNFAMLPRTLTEIYIVRQAVTGTITTSAFPDTLKYFFIDSCNMTGLLEIDVLPPNLIAFHVTGNFIDAISAIPVLPDTLDHFRVHKSGLAGKVVRIGALPPSKLRINLEGSNIQSVTLDNPLDFGRVLL